MAGIPVYQPGYCADGLINFLELDVRCPVLPETTSTASNTAVKKGASQTDKPKRKQFSSCDACRLRKVKCIRTDSTPSAACDACTAKSIPCLSGYSKEQVQGTGKRIKAAREAATLSVVPAERTLFEKALSSNALSGLLHAYAMDVQSAVPFVDQVQFPTIQQICQESRYEVARLDEVDQLLCLCITATAALVQDSRTHKRKTNAIKPATMTIYNPLSTSHDLAQKAIAEADRLCILRKPSMKGLQILRLLCLLTSADEAKQLRRSEAYRAYQRALVDHARTLMEKDELLEPQIHVLFWDLLTLDSFACAVSGQSPSFTDEDIENIAAFVDYSTEGMLNIISSIDAQSADVGMGLIFAGICRLLRSIYQRVTSFRARKRPIVDLEMMQEILPEIARLTSILDIYSVKVTSIFGTAWPDNLYFWSKLAGFLNTYIVVIALGELEKAISRESQTSTSGNRLQAMWALHRELQVKFVEDTHLARSSAPIPGTIKILGSVDGMMAFLSVVRLKRVLVLPTIEEAGPDIGLWTSAAKMRAARFYLEVCENLGETVIPIQEELPELRARVAALAQTEPAQAEYQRSVRETKMPALPFTDLVALMDLQPDFASRFTDLPADVQDIESLISQYCGQEQSPPVVGDARSADDVAESLAAYIDYDGISSLM